MARLRIPVCLVGLVKAYVQHFICKVKFNGELYRDFSVKTSLRQGYHLFPALFKISLESVVRKVLIDTTGLSIREDNN